MAIIKMIFKIGRNMEAYSIPVNLLRQWCFCPRIVYYRELLGMTALEPLWSQQGTQHHKRETELFKRRSNLSRFNLTEGDKHYNINLKEESLKMHGICDLAIETSTNIFAVEYKLGRKVSLGHIMQLLGYTLLAEKFFQKKATHGFILTGDNRVHTVKIDTFKRRQLKQTIDKIIKMLINGSKPYSSASEYQCGQCEYINCCNDREI